MSGKKGISLRSLEQWRLGLMCLALGSLCGPAWGQSASGSRYDCQTTPNGIPCKVIVKDENAAAYATEAFTGLGTPLKFFRKYFVFKQSTQGYQIGEATVSASILGWVRREQVIPWNIEQAIYFINKDKAGRTPVRIWQSREDIGDPTKPCFEEQLEVEHTTEPLPILRMDGSYVQVAFLWDVGGSAPTLKMDLRGETGVSGGDEVIADVQRGEQVQRKVDGKDLPGGAGQLQEIVQEARRMDVVLVMDVTGSMQSYMDQVRLNIVGIVEALRKMGETSSDVAIYVGMVAYRDYADSPMTVTCGLTTDCGEVVRVLDGLKAGGGAGPEEAVCNALYDGIQTMNWGAHSLRIMCLVGDAPPHTPDDEDTRKLRAAGTFVQSDFFGRPREENIQAVRRRVAEERIQFYAMGVGRDTAMQESFRSLVADSSETRFFALADSHEFISALARQLHTGRQLHQTIQKTLGKSIRGDRLTDQEREQLRLINIDAPEKLAEMRKERIQTGWFKPDEGSTCALCVYTSRRDLLVWQTNLRYQLLDYQEKQEDVFEGILGTHAGAGLKLRSINDTYRAARDLAVQPEILRLENLNIDEVTAVRKLRRKMNNITILLLTNKLFSTYEEGWVPMAYLPGSLTELRTP